MNGGTITLNGDVYRRVLMYAKEHNVSVDSFVENIVIQAVGMDKTPFSPSEKRFKLKSFDELSPRVRSLVGQGRVSEAANRDLNGRDARAEYLKEKYGI